MRQSQAAVAELSFHWKTTQCFSGSTLSCLWLGGSGAGCLVTGAGHQKGKAESESDPEARVLAVGARAPDPRKAFIRQLATQSKISAQPPVRKVGNAHQPRDLFWMLILYLIIVIGAVLGAIVFLAT